MRVIVPFAQTWLHPDVVPRVEAEGYAPELVECVNRVGHPMSYPSVLRDALLSGEDVCLVEQDILTFPGALKSLEECPEPWCFHAYDFMVTFEEMCRKVHAMGAPLGQEFAPLGHTRFRAGTCDPIREVLESDGFAHSWVSRDGWITPALWQAGIFPHRHEGKVEHTHIYE